jgi:succinoglycan biosynthesis protein ExoM
MTAPGSQGMAGTHVTVCICTYQRPALLGRLLVALEHQDTSAGFVVSVVVADNDRRRSAQEVVDRFSAGSPLAVTYCVEPEQNIALARNRAVQHATGDYVAFIDDDELPQTDWLVRMLEACRSFDADGMLGPVRPLFAQPPPAWLLKSRLCERPEHATGTLLQWRQTRAGNVLLRREVLDGPEEPFRREFGRSGEDQNFFKRMMERGRRFVWCNEAPVYETIPPERMSRRYFLTRALRRGQYDRGFLSLRSVVKSLLAVPAYTAVIPLSCVLGQHALMKYSVRLLDHVGRLLGAVGMEPVAGYLGDSTARSRAAEANGYGGPASGAGRSPERRN